MSASLVGSEMCIRDRQLVEGTGPGVLVEGLTPRRFQLAAPDLPLGEPVSYTHLTLPTICSV
eukprot:12720089-Alexandrium_andersonii.AAC.1